jgi:hypothetical protein
MAVSECSSSKPFVSMWSLYETSSASSPAAHLPLLKLLLMSKVAGPHNEVTMGTILTARVTVMLSLVTVPECVLPSGV